MLARPALVSLLATGALLAGGTSALAAGPGDDDADGTGPRLVERTLPGPAALRTLGAQGLQQAASRNDLTAARLADLLQDRSTRLAPNGRVFYADPVTPGAEHADAADDDTHTEGAETTATGTEAGTTDTPTPAYAADQAFSLHSRPGASRTIFLDFDGATVSNTWWNTYQGLPSTTVAAFSLDSDRGSFNNTERQLVHEVWARVAEDFAPFDVDVTTEAPAAGALTRTSSSDQTYGTQVLFAPGETVADTLCNGSCSGVAWVDVFDRVSSSSTPGPAWVFPDVTNRAGWRLTEVASHEAGHTLGLQHDGSSSSSYYTGRSPWGPIMGSARYGLTQWSNGDYADANNKQDDLSTISQNGATALTDDHADDAASAGSVSSSAPAAGVIGSRDDRDVFRLDHGACAVSAAVTTAALGPNLDVRLRLLDASGAVLASDNPTVTELATGVVTGTGASVNLPQRPAGTVYLEVDGVGQGTMPSSGYSDYGSVGRYSVSVTDCQGTTGTTSTTTSGTTGSGTSDSTGTTDDSSGTTDQQASAPTAARIGRARPGARGGRVTATATWAAPLSDGGSAITGYRVTALKVSRSGAVLSRRTWLRPAGARAFSPRLRRGLYRFQVVAVNAVGDGTPSAVSNRVRAR